MRILFLIWLTAIALGVLVLCTATSRYMTARSRASSAEARLVNVLASRAQLASLRQTLPAWTNLRPSEGLAPRLADSLAACGLPASTMSSLSAQAETVLVQPGASSLAEPSRKGAISTSASRSGGVKSRKAGITLTPITLSQLGRFMQAWREREPAWVISNIDVAPLNGATNDRNAFASASTPSSNRSDSSQVGAASARGAEGGRGGELPLRVVLTIESLWLDPPVPPVPPVPPSQSPSTPTTASSSKIGAPRP
ncbi:MAG: hypothetical protein AB7O77_15920 [Phycisphaerales bacterium]